MLLSTSAASPIPAEVATTTTTSPLGGTLRGTFLVHQRGSEIIYDYDMSAAGKMTSVGASSITVGLHVFPGTADFSPSGTMNLITSRGTLTLRMSDSLVTPPPIPTSPHEMVVTYDISDGTGAYRDDSGIGVVDFTFK